MPKIDLDLPDATRTIRASLPRLLREPYASPREEGTVSIEEAAGQPERSAAEVGAAELEIASPADLGLLIRRARERRKLSQQSFADLAGVGRRFLSELENGKATLELGKVLKVARAAGLALFARGR